jgi:hypothetical protein
VRKPNIFLHEFKERRVTAPVTFSKPRRVAPITFTIKNTRTANFTKTVVPGFAVSRQDFQVAGSGIAPRSHKEGAVTQLAADTAPAVTDADFADT